MITNAGPVIFPPDENVDCHIGAALALPIPRSWSVRSVLKGIARTRRPSSMRAVWDIAQDCCVGVANLVTGKHLLPQNADQLLNVAP